MAVVIALDPASKTPRAFATVDDLTKAIAVYKYIPIREDGSPMVVNYLTAEGGYLLDGAPMNVWLNQVWYEGQKEVANQYWGHEGVPYPSQAILSLPVLPMPQNVKDSYTTFKQSQGGLSTPMLFGIGVLAWWLLLRR